MKKIGLAIAVVLVGSVAVLAVKRGLANNQPVKGKTIVQYYWFKPKNTLAVTPRIDRVITRAILEDGSFVEKTSFLDESHWFFVDQGKLYGAIESQQQKMVRGDFSKPDSELTRNQMLTKNWSQEIILGYETFKEGNTNPDAPTQLTNWHCPALGCSLRLKIVSPESEQGIETVSIVDGIDPEFLKQKPSHFPAVADAK